MAEASSAPASTPPLRIALDPGLRAACGPELAWTWRLLLTTLGRPWIEVSAGEECEIAHLAPNAASRPRAAIEVRADPELWQRRDQLTLRGVDEEEGWSKLSFAGAGESGGGVTRGEGRVVIEHDLAFDVFWLGTARAEGGWPRNEHGHPQPQGALLEQGLFPQALASRLAARLERELLALGLAEGVPRWPGGKRAAACLTHDVDYPEAVRWLEPIRVLARRRQQGVKPALEVMTGRRSTWHFESWTRMEQRWGGSSAFYFVARKGSLREYATGTPDSFYDVTRPRFRELFRRLEAEGAEIGLHASYHAFDSAERFQREKERLERAAGVEVVGNRHHYLHLDPGQPEETLLLHEQLGFEYDTTLGHDRQLGWRNGLSHPFFPFHARLRRQLDTLQLPFAWMDQQLLLYGSANPGEAEDRLRDLAATAAEQGGCLVANIHEYTFDRELFPGWSDTYEALLRQIAERGDFWVQTPRRVAEHWRARASEIAAASRGLEDGPATPLPLTVTA